MRAVFQHPLIVIARTRCEGRDRHKICAKTTVRHPVLAGVDIPASRRGRASPSPFACIEDAMKAVVYKGKTRIAVQEQTPPELRGAMDALLRVTTAAICGSDLHMYEGRTPLQPGKVVGHEIMGVIEEVGSAVTSIRPGDRVVLPFNIACGYCYNCRRGYTNMCLTMNEEKAHAAYGYAGMGPYD